LYKDFNAKLKDFLSKEYLEKTKAEAKLHPTKNLTSTISMTRNADGSLVGVFSPKLVLPNESEVSGEFSSDPEKRVKGSLALCPGSYFPGLKVLLDYDYCAPFSAGFELKEKFFTLTTTFKLATSLSAAVTAGHKGFVVGGKAEVGVPTSTKESSEFSSNRELRDAELQLGYGRGFWEATAYVQKKGKVFGGSYYHELPSKKLIVGVDGSFDTSKKDEESSPKIEVGVSYTPDANTTLKAKINTDCILGLSFNHKLSQYARLTLSALANTSKLSASGNHKFGMSLILSD